MPTIYLMFFTLTFKANIQTLNNMYVLFVFKAWFFGLVFLQNYMIKVVFDTANEKKNKNLFNLSFC